MYRLDAGLQEALASGATIVVPSRQRAMALRQAWAWQQHEAGRVVWRSPDVLTWDAWLGRELTRQRHESGAGPVLLNPSQQHALWQQVLSAETEERGEGVPLRGFARAVAGAAALAREWLPDWKGPAPTEESRLLQRALARMDALCAERGVLAAALATAAQLDRLPAVSLVFAGVPRLTPRQQKLAERFESAGAPVRLLPLPGEVRDALPPRAVSTPDAASESVAVAAWCQERLRADPRARLLVVVGDPRAEATPLRDAIAARLGAAGEDAVIVEGGTPLALQPLVATALDWLALAAPEIEFEPLSAMLCSPFHRLADPVDCARLDLWLRDRVPQRCECAALLRLLQTAPAGLASPAHALAGALAALQQALVPARRGPRDWVARFSSALEALGHPGARSPGSAELQAWQRWEAGLEEFASLQGYVPALDTEGALRQLRALVERSQHQAATGDAPVTVTRWRGDPLVDYDGIWVTGLAESQWPEAPRPDPFLPLRLQRDVGHPSASAQSRLAQARDQLACWRTRAAGELVLSHPRTEGDVDLGPSVLLRGLPAEPLEAPSRPAIARPGATRPAPAEARLPALAPGEAPLRAGTRVPELQRDCAFRAQAELRLGAQGLAAPRVGIDPALRGRLVHRALEALWQQVRSGQSLRARPADGWEAEIDAALATAFDERALQGQGLPPTPRQLERERERCRRLLRDALDLERARDAEFTVEASEQQSVWEVAGARLRVRLDRLDRLADGSRVVIDYKTGASARVDLLSDAPRPVQLLAYLDLVAGDVAAMALLRLSPGRTAFSAVEDGRARLPQGTRSTVQTTDRWPERLADWRDDVRRLVARYLAGEAEVAPLPGACQYCELPALCRIDSVQLGDSLSADDPSAEDGVP